MEFVKCRWIVHTFTFSVDPPQSRIVQHTNLSLCRSGTTLHRFWNAGQDRQTAFNSEFFVLILIESNSRTLKFQPNLLFNSEILTMHIYVFWRVSESIITHAARTTLHTISVNVTIHKRVHKWRYAKAKKFVYWIYSGCDSIP